MRELARAVLRVRCGEPGAELGDVTRDVRAQLEAAALAAVLSDDARAVRLAAYVAADAVTELDARTSDDRRALVDACVNVWSEMVATLAGDRAAALARLLPLAREDGAA